LCGFVSHHDYGGVPLHVILSMNDCSSESVLSLILNRRQRRDSRLQFLQNLPNPVTAPVVDRDSFVGDIMKRQFEIEVVDGGGDTPFLLARE
jgi:hypothetical protein